LFDWKWFPENYFSNFHVFVCHQESWLTENTLQSKKNLAWFPRKCFLFILSWKHFPEVVKYLEMSYYLLIISNLVLKLLIAIYIFFEYFFSISSLQIDFYINFGLYFYNCYLLFPYHFLIENFYLSNLVIILLIVTYFIWNNLWNGNHYYFNFIFQIFYLLDLIFIIFIIIYFIWVNLWKKNFNFILIQLFSL